MDHFVDAGALRSIVAEAKLLRGILSSQNMNDQLAALDSLIEDISGQRFAIGVVGLGKRGKSTLLNAVLGRRDDVVAPVGRFPATNVVSMFGYSASEESQVVFHDGRVQKISFGQIRQYACEEGNKDNARGVKSIEIKGPFPGLQPNVFLVDTPGAGNALSSVHDEVLLNILPRLDALVFLVTADSPINQDELDLLMRIRGQQVKKVLFAVNKIDLCDANEIEEAFAHNQRILTSLGYGDVQTFAISAKQHFETGSEGGTVALITAIRQLLAEGRVQTMVARATERLEAIRVQAEAEIAKRLEETGKSSVELEAEKRAVQADRQKLSSAKYRLEAEFRAQWGDGIGKYERILPRLRQGTKEAYSATIVKTSATKLGDMGKMIHTDVVLRVQEVVEPHALELTKTLSQAVDGLQVSSQQVLMRTDVSVAAPVATNISGLKDVGTVVLAAAPSLAIAAGAALISGGIASLAPAAVAITLNPSTWGAFAASVVGGAATAGITVAVAPIATVLAPAALVWAGYRSYCARTANAAKNRNTLQMQVNRIVDDCFDQVHETLAGLRRQESRITADYFSAVDAKLQEAEERLEALTTRTIPPRQLEEWRDALAQLRHEPYDDAGKKLEQSATLLTRQILG